MPSPHRKLSTSLWSSCKYFLLSGHSGNSFSFPESSRLGMFTFSEILLTVSALGPFCLYHTRDKTCQMWQLMGISRCSQALRPPRRHPWSLCYAHFLRGLVYIPEFSATCLFESHVPPQPVFLVTIIHQAGSLESTIQSDIKVSSSQDRLLGRHVWPAG